MRIPSDQSGIVPDNASPRPDVLVVDDEPASVALLSRILTNAGHRVLSATNGVEAMRSLLTNGTQLVITDWSMPEMDGIELCRAIRGHEGIPFAYILMVTGQNTERAHLVTAFEAGADDFLCKPVNQVELLARLRAAERIIRLQRELNSRSLEAFRHNAKMEIINTELGDANAKLHRMATTDELTGLMNRREAMTRLAQEWSSADRHHHPLAIVSLDIDRFKHCNDAYGHAVGDEVLRSTTRTIAKAIRRGDIVARVGGEEFLIICPHATEAMAVVGAERVRAACEAQVIHSESLTLGATVSAGVAERTPAMTSLDDMIQAADSALYAAKDAGRNVVRLASQANSEESDDTESIDGEAGDGTAVACTTDKPITVLLVDDDASTRSLSRRFLLRSGCLVVEAEDGIEALANAEACPPDVIVMDAMMPNLDGLECTRQLKKDPRLKSIPVVIASARSDATDVVAGLQAGADEYLAKPINADELILRVKTLVRMNRELRQSNAGHDDHARAMSVVYAFTLEIAAAETIDTALEATVKTASLLTRCPRVALLLPDQSCGRLTVARSFGYSERDVADLWVPFGEAVSGVVFKSREAIMISTVDETPPNMHATDGVLLSETPSLSIAMNVPDRTVGVLNLNGHNTGLPFTPLELNYIELIANIAATGLDDRMRRRSRDDARHSIIVALAKLAEHRASSAKRHIERVTEMSCILAEQLRTTKLFAADIDDAFVIDLRHAAPLHDIGKVAVPDRVILKADPLTADESLALQQHTVIGEAALESVPAHLSDAPFLPMAREIAGAHHEWFNGSGHPKGLRGGEIPLAARIFAVADVYDAVTTERVYKAAMTHERAVEIITATSGTQFDPHVVDAFLARRTEIAELAAELSDDPKPGDGSGKAVSSPSLAVPAGC